MSAIGDAPERSAEAHRIYRVYRCHAIKAFNGFAVSAQELVVLCRRSSAQPSAVDFDEALAMSDVGAMEATLARVPQRWRAAILT